MKFDLHDLVGVILVLTISFVCGLNSLQTKIKNGYTVTVFWILSEVSMSVLMGFIANDAYTTVQPYLWGWVTKWLFIAFCSYGGVRILQVIEQAFRMKYFRGFLRNYLNSTENKDKNDPS